ncbi:hypothetical protein G3N18_01895 [Microbacterium sp. 2C]|uniref:hypothetical protein n=1 Tax=Microbacterium paulum TaxID=2707006 RepID=UPI0018C2CD0E|nr:hypothetical protein [Microbacterium paulum]MBG0716839.1 hypothetical protein [Microbacterium paulum]
MTGSDLTPRLGSDAASTRESLVAARTELARQRASMEAEQQRQRADLEKQRKELEAQFDKARRELEARMAPLKQQLEQMAEVLWTVDLYLGRDEQLQLVRDGKPAPAETPITLRQKVLVMAEESLIMMGGTHTGLTADNIPEFIDWLISDAAHLDRVLPEPKGVVVLIPTKVESRSGNLWEDAGRDAANQRSYWLLRNGEKLYLLTVDPALRIRDRVLPRRREFVEVFDRGLFGFGRGAKEPVRPGSEEWFEIEKIADARRRHYMRIMLVLQGLVDRTPVWHPLPPAGVSFLSIADQDAGKIQLIQDDEDSIQLGEGGESFESWQRRLNKMLRPGLRVIGNWGVRDFRSLHVEGDKWTRGYHPRLHPGNAEYPAANVPHLIEGRRDGGFVIRYERAEPIYKRNMPVPGEPGYIYRGETAATAQLRASCVIMPDDSWVLPFDLVSIPELERFLYSREERSKHFLSMVPTIRAALDAKHSEAQQENDFRGLIGQLLVTEGADAETIEQLVDELVHWWKLAHTWTKPLNGSGTHEKRAADQILTEHRSRRASAVDHGATQMIKLGSALPGAIAVARDRQGRWFAYTPSPDDRKERIYLDVTRLYRNGKIGTTSTWQLLPQRTASALHVAWKSEAWDTWTFGANPSHHLTAPERQSLIAAAIERTPGTALCVTELWDPRRPASRKLFTYAWAREGTPADAQITPDHDPLSWHHQADPVVRSHGWDITRLNGAVSLTPTTDYGEAPHAFSTYSGGSRWGHTPWWPADARDYGDTRPTLAWADEQLLDELTQWRTACRLAQKAADDERAAFAAEANRYTGPVVDLIRQQVTDAAHARFVEDYGPNAEDLWPAHLKTLNLERQLLHPRTVQGIIAISLRADRPVIGRTLGELADYASEHGNAPGFEWHPTYIAGVTPRSHRVDLNGFDSLTVPNPPSEETSEP